jgi:hypothetical protein
MNLLIFHKLLKKLRFMNIKINRLEEGHNLYPLVCRRPAETVSLQRRQICYRWGTPAYWSLVPRNSMFYLFEFCLKNMWNYNRGLYSRVGGHRGHDRMVVGFTSTYAISAYHHWSCEFESRSGRSVEHFVITFVSDLWQIGGFLRVLRFPPPITLTAPITEILLKVALNTIKQQTNKQIPGPAYRNRISTTNSLVSSTCRTNY